MGLVPPNGWRSAHGVACQAEGEDSPRRRLWRSGEQTAARRPDQLISVLCESFQITAIGATWLDRQLVSRKRVSLDASFGRDVRQALQAWIDHLVAEGAGTPRGERRNFHPTTLRNPPPARAKRCGGQRRVKDRTSVLPCGGRRSNLTSGRFAVIEDRLGFSFVPSKPALERHLGRGAWRELYIDTPQMANTLLAVLRVLIAFGVPRGYIDRNPNDVKPLALVDDERQRPWPKEAFKRSRPPISLSRTSLCPTPRGNREGSTWPRSRSGWPRSVCPSTPRALPRRARMAARWSALP